MSILVTGGCGYIGSHVLNLLKQDPQLSQQKLLIVDNLSSGFTANLLHTEHQANFHQISLEDTNALKALFNRQKETGDPIKSIIHFAASIDVAESVSNPAKYYFNNSFNTLILLNLCQEFGVANFVFSSTAAVYGPQANGIASEDSPTAPVNPYGWSKLFSEQMLKDFSQKSDLNFVVLRYFNVAGAEPNGRLGRRNKSHHLIQACCRGATGEQEAILIFGEDYETPDGTGIRDYIHVQDLAEAHVLALQYLESNTGKIQETFNVGYGHGYSVKQVIKSTEKVSQKAIRVRIHPRRDGDLAKIIADSSKITSILNWKPKYDNLETIIKHELDWSRLSTI